METSISEPGVKTLRIETDQQCEEAGMIRFDVWFCVNWCRVSPVPHYSMPVNLGEYPS